MIKTITIYFLLFITYSLVGWLVEVFLKYIELKKFINRGFLIGPWLPIYGFGSLLITILLSRYSTNPVIVFLLAMVICALLEYITSYILEKIFHARWWDYSTKKFNINGRICLGTTIPFGICGLILIYITNPFLLNIYNSIDNNILIIISVLLFIIFIIDNIFSFNLLSLIRNDIKMYEKDNTEEISLKIKKKLKEKEVLLKRLLQAFPYFKNIWDILEKKHKEIIKSIDKKYRNGISKIKSNRK